MPLLVTHPDISHHFLPFYMIMKNNVNPLFDIFLLWNSKTVNQNEHSTFHVSQTKQNSIDPNPLLMAHRQVFMIGDSFVALLIRSWVASPFLLAFLPSPYVITEKVLFTVTSVNLFTGEGVPYPMMHCPLHPSQEGPARKGLVRKEDAPIPFLMPGSAKCLYPMMRWDGKEAPPSSVKDQVERRFCLTP